MAATKTAPKTGIAGRIEKLRALAEHPNTPEHEADLARHTLARLLAKVAEAAGTAPAGYTDRRWYGAKYDHTHKLTTVDIAKLIRDEIKLLRKVGKSSGVEQDGALKLVDPIGDMPAQIKVSVRSQYYSGGSSIDIKLENVPLGWGFVPAAEPTEYRRFDRSPALNALTAALTSLMGGHNHDGSDPVSDYYDKRFLGFVEVAHPEDTDCPHGYRLTDSCPCC